MKSLEVIVRANITVKSSIKNLLLRDASTMVSCLPGWRTGPVGGSPRSPLSPAFALLTPCFSDPSDGVLGPCGCGCRRSPLVGHPPGSAGWASGAGPAGAAVVEGEARGGMETVGTGIRGRGLAAHSHRFTQQLLPRALTVHAPGTLSALDGSELAPVQTLSSRLV